MPFAIISVSNKNGILEFAQQLRTLKIDILASGGTAKFLQDHQIPVTEVSDYTKFPEILSGRVKTLHPKIHAGILARLPRDTSTLNEHFIQAIDIVVVNLYPFEKTIENKNTTFEEAIEQIDVGGPTLLRAGAKNHERVTVIVDPDDYQSVIEEWKKYGNTEQLTRVKLAGKVFKHTALYDSHIANYFSQHTNQNSSAFPSLLMTNLEKKMDLRYGENPTQSAAIYTQPGDQAGVIQATLVQGKPLSYNNLLDADGAFQLVHHLPDENANCVIIKHNTPCGVAAAKTVKEAYKKAFSCDSSSAFGGVIAMNRELTAEISSYILENQFLEILLAPSIAKEALPILATKPSLRVLSYNKDAPSQTIELRSIIGGLLAQTPNQAFLDIKDIKIVSQRKPTDQEWQDCLFAWHVVRYVKSNAIVLAKNLSTIGIGTGQTSRVFSIQIACERAKLASLNTQGSVMASDAFLPFVDNVELAAEAGITTIIQPGGAKRDEEVIEKANSLGIAMLFTGIREFRH